MNLVPWIVLGVFFYIVAWVTIINNAVFVPNKDKFTLRVWIGIHIVALGIVFTFLIRR